MRPGAQRLRQARLGDESGCGRAGGDRLRQRCIRWGRIGRERVCRSRVCRNGIRQHGMRQRGICRSSINRRSGSRRSRSQSRRCARRGNGDGRSGVHDGRPRKRRNRRSGQQRQRRDDGQYEEIAWQRAERVLDPIRCLHALAPRIPCGDNRPAIRAAGATSCLQCITASPTSVISSPRLRKCACSRRRPRSIAERRPCRRMAVLPGPAQIAPTGCAGAVGRRRGAV